jgi:hypothetical protein
LSGLGAPGCVSVKPLEGAVPDLLLTALILLLEFPPAEQPASTCLTVD